MQTSHFNFDGLILRDAGFWSFMVVRSDNVTIKNLKGFQDLYKIENDVIDINESQNVLVQHSIATSDDDTYSTKIWLQTGMSKDWPGALEHFFRVQDASNYYLYRINAANQMLELYKSIQGQLTLAASAPFAAQEKQWTNPSTQLTSGGMVGAFTTNDPDNGETFSYYRLIGTAQRLELYKSVGRIP